MATRPYDSAVDSVSAGDRPGLIARLHLDLPLLVGVLLLCGYGLLVLFSATDQNPGKVEGQMLRIIMAFGVMLALAQVSPGVLRRWAAPLYLAGVLLLVAVLIVGDIGKGAQRWLDLGVLRFQPSELLKVAVPMMLAWFLSGRPMPPCGWRILVGALIIAVPTLLIFEQPDLGTAVLVAGSGAMVLFLAGMSWRLILGVAVLAASTAPVLWYLLRDYQRQRVLTFLDPTTDPLGSGYHIIQSQIAVGSGGLYGKGWFNGTQSHLEFLPERTTDFIFAVLGEELGLTGALVLMAIYLFIILRGLYIAALARDTFGRLLAGGLSLIFFVYVFVNTGMVSGLLPVVGVPLPLVSYGGTSLVTIMAGFGMIMSIHTHRKRFPV
jgi:rod shape determining protein RodA